MRRHPANVFIRSPYLLSLALAVGVSQAQSAPMSNRSVKASSPVAPQRPTFVFPCEPMDTGISTNASPGFMLVRPGRPRWVRLVEPLDIGVSTCAAYVLEGCGEIPVVVAGGAGASSDTADKPNACVEILTSADGEYDGPSQNQFFGTIQVGGAPGEGNGWEYAPSSDSPPAVSMYFGSARICMRPLRLEYVSGDGARTCLVAEVRAHINGETSDEGLYFADAFDSLDADLLIRIAGGQAEQSLILRETPPSPEALGLEGSDGVRLRMVAVVERLGAAPVRVARPGDAAAEKSLSLPVRITGDADDSATDVCFPVAFAYSTGGWGSDEHPCGKVHGLDAVRLSLMTNGQEWLLYQDVPLERIGSVPYVIESIARVPVDVDELRFRRETTYLVRDDLVVDGGRIVFEPGAVIKLAPDAGIYIGADVELSFMCNSLEPAYITTVADNTVGVPVPDASGGYDDGAEAGSALVVVGGPGTVRGLEIRHASCGLVLVGGGESWQVRDVRVADCCEGIAAVGNVPELQLYNCLEHRTESGLYTLANETTVDFCTFVGVGDAVVRGQGVCTLRDSLVAEADKLGSESRRLEITCERVAFYDVKGTPHNMPGGIFLSDSPFIAVGDFHLAAESVLRDMSTRRASECGLYHYSTEVDGAEEGSGKADIGYHYASDEDTDGDGVADVLEDRSGDGLADDGDPSNWLVAESPDLLAELYALPGDASPATAASACTNGVQILFVDAKNGSDSADGAAPVSADGHGPLRTLSCALSRAGGPARIVVSDGVLNEGDVVISGDDQVVIKPTRVTVIR